MSSWGLYLVFLLIPLVFGMVIQTRLRSTVNKYMIVPASSHMTGAQVARMILDRNGLTDVPVEASPGGPLSDHYDPRGRSVHLSEPVYGNDAVASVAIGAHEVGHALQHAQGYAFFKFRSAMWPVVAFASNAWFFILLAGMFMNVLGMIQIAVVLFAVVVLFQLVTLPVEFDASRRAMAQLKSLGIVTNPVETNGASAVLKSAAMTYVAGALAAVAQLAYYVLIFLGNRS